MYQTKRIDIRLTEEERGIIDNLSKELHITKTQLIRYFIYMKADDLKTRFKRDKIFKEEMKYQLARYGNNINQIAKNTNILIKRSNAKMSNEIAQTQVDALKNIDKSLKEILRLLEDEDKPSNKKIFHYTEQWLHDETAEE